MKKLLIIISILFTLIMVGALYGTQAGSEKKEPVALEEEYAAHLPNPMSEVNIPPMTNGILF